MSESSPNEDRRSTNPYAGTNVVAGTCPKCNGTNYQTVIRGGVWLRFGRICTDCGTLFYPPTQRMAGAVQIGLAIAWGIIVVLIQWDANRPARERLFNVHLRQSAYWLNIAGSAILVYGGIVTILRPVREVVGRSSESNAAREIRRDIARGRIRMVVAVVAVVGVTVFSVTCDQTHSLGVATTAGVAAAVATAVCGVAFLALTRRT